MEHNLFKPKSFEEGQHAVVGDCNGYTMQQRWDAETPAFAREIIKNIPLVPKPTILDYGCGVGRIAKAVIDSTSDVCITGVDASSDMLDKTRKYIDSGSDDLRYQTRFKGYLPSELIHSSVQFDLAYCVYVLQHVPAIEIREILARIHFHLKDDGVFIYCSSDYRMAIRYDGQGFFDDRFLGVNLQEEVQRYFKIERPLFDQVTLDSNPILKTMIQGGLPHPAFVCSKKKITGQYFNAQKEVVDGNVTSNVQSKENNQVSKEIKKEEKIINHQDVKKILLVNRLAPGDILVMTNALRDLHKAYPGRFVTDVRTPCNEIFDNNPYITHLHYDESKYQQINSRFSRLDGIKNPSDHTDFIDDILVIDMHYELIHSSGVNGWHFGYGHRDWLEKVLGLKIPQTDIRPELYLSATEKTWVNPLVTEFGFKGQYWVINAGSKGDYTLKQYPFYQKVIDMLKGRVEFVQVGLKEHNHEALEGAIDMRGKTNNMRDLFRLIHHADGVMSCVSFHMHIAAALKKPCVVVAGAREGTRWELYPNHQFLYVNGCLPCATYDGCWKSKFGDCNNKRENIPMCMHLIRPSDIVRAVERYYEGGMIEHPDYAVEEMEVR